MWLGLLGNGECIEVDIRSNISSVLRKYKFIRFEGG